MTYVYLIYDAGHGGPENLFATLDRAFVPALLEMNLDAFDSDNDYKLDRTSDRAGLAELLTQADDNLAGEHEVTDGSGRGGTRFAVVPLQCLPSPK